MNFSIISIGFDKKNVFQKDFLEGSICFEKQKTEDITLQNINDLFRYTYTFGFFDEKYNRMTVDKSILQKFFKPDKLYDNRHVENLLDGSVVYHEDNSNKKDPYERSKKRIDAFLKTYKGKHIIPSIHSPKGRITVQHNNKYIGELINDNSGGSINTLEIRYEGLWFENNHVYNINDEGKKELLF